MTRAEEVWRVVIELSSTGRDLMNHRWPATLPYAHHFHYCTHVTHHHRSYLSYLVDTHPLPTQVSTGLALSLSLSPRNVLLAPLARTSPRIYLPRALLIFHHVIMSLFPTTSVSRRTNPRAASDKNGRESGFAPKSDYKHAGPRSMNRSMDYFLSLR